MDEKWRICFALDRLSFIFSILLIFSNDFYLNRWMSDIIFLMRFCVCSGKSMQFPIYAERAYVQRSALGAIEIKYYHHFPFALLRPLIKSISAFASYFLSVTTTKLRILNRSFILLTKLLIKWCVVVQFLERCSCGNYFTINCCVKCHIKFLILQCSVHLWFISGSDLLVHLQM